MKSQLRDILEKIAGTAALAFSHQAEDAAVLHLLLQEGGLTDRLAIFTLDTKKLFPETLVYHHHIEEHFNISIKKYEAEAAEIAELEAFLGDEWGMRTSLEHRHRCCEVRKVIPLRRALQGKSAWITGMRAAQSITRQGLPLLEYDENNGLIKINPLAAWSDSDLAAYIAQHNIPLHPLYAEGFKSIGCSPCTRAVSPGEDIRAGRWWWENPEHKECGLHRARK